jgi:hypothetical protein
MKINLSDLYQSAHAAGNAAVESTVVRPMIVHWHGDPVSLDGEIKQTYVVDDGVCGFASVIVKPANSAFAKYLKDNHGAYKSYYGGVSLSIHDFNQSLQKKEAYAKAFAGVLVDAGINAHYESRMD